jgi:formate-dependent nitrite reductase cytochrome c552 subunit
MKISGWARLAFTVLLVAFLAGCGRGPDEVKKVVSEPKTYVGSEQCKMCHLEHYDSWRGTLHSRTIQDVTQNLDAMAATMNPEAIRADLRKMEKDLKVPVDDIYIPEVEDLKYTIGVQWKQGYIVEKEGTLYVAPIEYDIWENSWLAYREDDWDKRSWIKDCSGCHTTGVDLEKGTFVEGRVGCEACHGPGSHHVVLPKTAIFDKRTTIVNPATLPAGLRTQVCGSCHGTGVSTTEKDVAWPVGYRSGRALGPYFDSPYPANMDAKIAFANGLAQGHHQEYNAWKLSTHAKEGVTCTSCHFVHQLGVAPTQFQTMGSGSEQCLRCHRVINTNQAHSIHSFANCVGCHMPRIVESAESGNTHSHAFVTLLPKETLQNPRVPNSCQTCHKHKDADLATLQQVFDGLTKKTLLGVHRTR